MFGYTRLVFFQRWEKLEQSGILHFVRIGIFVKSEYEFESRFKSVVVVRFVFFKGVQEKFFSQKVIQCKRR